MAGSVERGRVFTRWLVAGQVVLTLGGLVAAIDVSESGFRAVGRAVLSLTFAVAAYRGVRAAAVASGIMMFVSALVAFWWTAEFFEQVSYWSALFAIVGVFALIGGVQLIVSPDIKAFQAFQREKRGGWRLEKPAPREADVKDQSTLWEEAGARKAEEATRRKEEVVEDQATHWEAEVARNEEEEAARRQAEAAGRKAEAAGRVRPELTVARRERLLRYAAMLAAFAILMQWLVGFWTSSFPARATLTLVGALVMLAFALKGSTYGRFAGVGITFMLIVIGFLRFSQQSFLGAAAFTRALADIDLLLLGVALAGFILGVERPAAAAASFADRALRAFLGAMIGALVAFVGGRPTLAFCMYDGTGYWRDMRCNDFHDNSCERVKGCTPAPARCVPRCELATATEDCKSPCAWQDDRCVHPKNVCSAPTTFYECRETGLCEWVECTGEPEPCSAHSYNECPSELGCRKVQR